MAKLIVCTMAIMVCCAVVSASSILTFDGVPSGTVLQDSSYALGYRVAFSGDFRATDHTASTWGPPHSGSNVLTSVGDYAVILFGHYTATDADPDYAQSTGAYFSTDTGVIIRMTAYHWNSPGPEMVTSVVIGAPGESWNNRYIEISTSLDRPFEMLEFEGVNSPSDLLGFCADDMSITLVPEPSSLLALGAGGLGMLGMALRRRRSR